MSTVDRGTSRPDQRARRARVAVAVLFFTNGALFANLLPRYPEIKEGLGLSNAAFGAAVAAFPLGALVAGLSAGLLIRRFGSARVAIGATLLATIGFVTAGASSSWAMLAAGLFIAGAMDAITDVAQNSHGLRVQRLYGRSILNSFHAVWSMGAVLGGIMGAILATVGLSTTQHMVVSASVFGLAALASYRWLLQGPEPLGEQRDAADASADVSAEPRSKGAPSLVARYGVLLALVAIAASGAVVEDSGASWAAIYLTGSFESTAFLASFGFIALQGLQFVGRIFGDTLVDRFGQRAVARAGGTIVFLGMGFALLVPTVVGTITGFGLAGLGVATLIPAAMHSADQIPGFAPGSGLTIVSWLLRIGFLVAPPLVGAIADATSLRAGLLIVPAVGLVVIACAGVLPTKLRTTHSLSA
ncbi:Fucose permease [Sanguibacter gelidistatuariae]|uniref:Fucose permease n=1 Tax=Sanguibacter gelidistatuariae TaxID=1814289 RepID=A0A1G6H4Q4_9MICO|nr:MFS transporter [Sanguibacter gelidistatuariae]SDB89249.1 Fucose permease [Sanguibacter gelidistatuariae]